MAAVSTPSTNPRRPLLVLIVDDYPDAATSLALVLDLEGFSVRVALSCREARDVIAEREPDVILMDLGLPDGNGYDFALELGARLRRPPVLVSLSGFNPDHERVVRAGFVRYFVKPADLGELASYLRTCSEAR